MASGRWAEIRERATSTPEIKARYELKRRAVVQTRQLLMEIEVTREQSGLSKAELARRMGADPSVVRRVLSNPNSNPTFRTILDMLNALDLNIEIKPSSPTTPPTPEPEKTRTPATGKTGSDKPRTRKEEAA